MSAPGFPRAGWKAEKVEPKARRGSDALRHSLVLPGFIDAIARRMMLGAEKYSDWNWQQDMPLEVIFDHLQTHLNALRVGKIDDMVQPVMPGKTLVIPNDNVQENGLANIAAIACNTMMLWWYTMKHPERLKEYQERQR